MTSNTPNNSKPLSNMYNDFMDLVYKVSALSLKSLEGKDLPKEKFSQIMSSDDAKSFLSVVTNTPSPMVSAAKSKVPRTSGTKGTCVFELQRGERKGDLCDKSASYEHAGKFYCKTHYASVTGTKETKKKEGDEPKEKKVKSKKTTSKDKDSKDESKKIDVSKMKTVLSKKPVTHDVSNPPFDGAKFEKNQGFVLDGNTVRGLADGKVDGNRVAISNYTEVLTDADKARAKKYGYKVLDETVADKPVEKKEAVKSPPKKEESVKDEEEDDEVPQIDDEDEGDD